MKNKFFYIPIFLIAAITVVVSFFAYQIDAQRHPERSSLLINLVASGITVICTSLLIDKSIRDERRKDSQPGLDYANKIINQEVEWFFLEYGHFRDAIDSNKAIGSTIDMGNRDIPREYKHGLNLARITTTKTFTGKHKNIASWFIQPAERVKETLDEVLNNFNHVLSFTDSTKLYTLRKDIISSLRQLNQYFDSEYDSSVGRITEDEGYVSNEDFTGDKLSSMKAYETNHLLQLIVELDAIELKSPSA